MREEDFLSALTTAIGWHEGEFAAIAAHDAPATFDNTIAALERSGEPLARVRRLFWTLSSAQGYAGHPRDRGRDCGEVERPFGRDQS